MSPKERAGRAAVELIKSGMIVGLGTGSTAKLFIDALGEAVKAGSIKNIRCIPTSRRSEDQARALGIPLTDFVTDPIIDITVDGADEVAPDLNLIKGLGGAMLREKIIAQNSRRLVIVADDSKKVAVLGSKAPVPVEVIPFAHEAAARFLNGFDCEVTLRRDEKTGTPYLTDNGNYVYDCQFSGIPDPQALERQLMLRSGIVQTGLFLGIADTALIASDTGVETLTL